MAKQAAPNNFVEKYESHLRPKALEIFDLVETNDCAPIYRINTIGLPDDIQLWTGQHVEKRAALELGSEMDAVRPAMAWQSAQAPALGIQTLRRIPARW